MIHTFYTAAALSSSSARHWSKFPLEHGGYLLVGSCRIDESDELFGCVTFVHVEGEQAAIFAADGTGRFLQLCPFVTPDKTIAQDEGIYRGYRWRQSVRIEIVSGIGASLEMYG
jgi:hypothetical protein